MNLSDLQKRDLKHLWHPCAQMKDYESFPPMEIVSAKGSLLQTANDGEMIDIISSWWCKSLGHGHEDIQQSVKNQMDKFEHVILANTSNELIVNLCEKMIALNPAYDKVFFADSGSDGVEVAVKMSLQYQQQNGQEQRKKFMSLQNAYHGETILTLALGDCGLYSAPYAALMPEVKKILDVPYVTGRVEDLEEEDFSELLKPLEEYEDELAGIVIEPVLQGAGGMLFYHPSFIKALREWTSERGVHLIADEILTGIGRLGKARACEFANVVPDFSVFSKSMTAGFTPMSCVLTTNEIFDGFYDEYESGRAFMHSNTYTGNAISAAAAVAAIDYYEREQVFARVAKDSAYMHQLFEDVAKDTGALLNVRSCGFVAAADLDVSLKGLDKKRCGYSLYKKAVKKGLLLRPLGDTVYFLPPLNTSNELLAKSADIMKELIFEELRS
ncbi:adenosylmethionine-8-amino-7-oxononanoate aminotransferase [Lentisphaera araneosa HTCC2155]|uniref:Adenosylmethionine-8-amino-7-oxononanoate aminotransferase n=1 Tax=Lentisphaera araneosa HTCC2155 TaxID=313628 RepID=A6DH19_9BACT|nr:adenosylmethionine--8-amino-7-oxononanoate transaminase [Lentisphaera araneosa]EDM28902.1 adenosylmethionine-8-amino-7-oxononanoate aminotransferase [Lentisphaera araneosa HTCC2155]